MTGHRRPIPVICGSLRDNGLSAKLSKAMCLAAGDRLDCRRLQIGDLPLYDADIDSSPPEAWQRFRRELAACEGVLFVTPEYNRSIPGALKNAIDVGSRPYGKSSWAKKPAAIVSLSPGALGGFGANHHLRQCCVFLDMPVMQQPEAYVGGLSDDKFGVDGRITDESLAKLMDGIITAFADWVDLIHAGRAALAPDPSGSGA